jgi:DNA-directed RNA polymerase specialized sigma24 family protein
MREIGTYRKGQPSDERFGVELFRRATVQGDQDAWACLRQCFGELVRGWMYRHPAWEVASGLESEENYLALTFERFWLAAAYHQQLNFSTLASALKYLRVSLNSAILDVLRASRSKEVALPEPDSPGEPAVEDTVESGELWEFLQQLFPNEREQRLIYLLYHCGLKPREIVRLCPQAFNDVREVYRLHRSIVERLLRNADRLRWRLGSNE